MKIEYFKIGKICIDFRNWYQVWTPKGRDFIHTEYEGWSNIWYDEYEIENWLQEEPDLVYRKMNFFHHNFLHNKHHILTFLKYILIFIAAVSYTHLTLPTKA